MGSAVVARGLWSTGSGAPLHVAPSRIRDRTRAPCLDWSTLTHRTAREVLPFGLPTTDAYGMPPICQLLFQAPSAALRIVPNTMGHSLGWGRVQFSRSVVSNSLRPHESQHTRSPCPSPTPRVYSNLMSIKSVMPSNHLILCRPLLLLPSIPPSIRVFSNESTLRMRWPKYWSFSFSVSPSNEHPGLISLRMDWLDLLAVQGTLKLLQHHSSKASILQHSAFFTVPL